MKGFQKCVLSLAVLAGGLVTTGCHTSDEWKWHGDPCWLERYANEARKATVANFQPQVENGHVLDQTIWNMHFDYGTDKLNAGGMDKLDQLARRRPAPDPRIFLQTSRDIPYDAEKPGDYASKRVDLDTKRVAAVQKYLKATLTGREFVFDLQIHDPAYPGIDVNPGVAPRLYEPAPIDRAGGANIPPVPVSAINGAAAAGRGAGGAGARGGQPAGGGAAGGGGSMGGGYQGGAGQPQPGPGM